jgi:NhaP-type Na+/H+ or K+/H+ antiporter
LFLFLPTLIFESAFSIEPHQFRRTFNQISILAVPRLILSTVLTAVLVKYLFPWDWSWPIALMFGALVSAAEPIAVVALLKEMSSRKRLETLIEGESLLNDGTAIVIFTLFYRMLSVTNGGEFNLLNVIGQFSWVVSFGLFIGLVLGWCRWYGLAKCFTHGLQLTRF